MEGISLLEMKSLPHIGGTMDGGLQIVQSSLDGPADVCVRVRMCMFTSTSASCGNMKKHRGEEVELEDKRANRTQDKEKARLW